MGIRSRAYIPRGSLFYLAKDAQDVPIEAGPLASMEQAWQKATRLFAERDEIKRVIFYEYSAGVFIQVNADNRPAYFKREDDVLSQEGRKLLLAQVES